MWRSSHSLPIPYNVFSRRWKRFHSSKVTTGTCPMRFVDFPRFQITLNFFQFSHVVSIFFPVKINPSSPAVLAPYLPPTLTNIPIKPLVLLIPGTQMTLVLNGKGLVLWGWPSKIEVIKGFQANTYMYLRVNASPGIGYLPLSPPHGCLVEGVHLFGSRFLPGIEVLHGKVTAWTTKRSPFPAGVFRRFFF